jgi:hypothetical protein
VGAASRLFVWYRYRVVPEKSKLRQELEERAPDVDELLGELEKKIDRCKHLYDQYFQGFEKRPPTTLLKDVVRSMHDLDQMDIRRAGTLFRYRSLLQRYNAYRTMWNRNLREIELGTSKRDLSRLARRLDEKTGRLFRGARSVGAMENAIARSLQRDPGAAQAADATAAGVNTDNAANVPNTANAANAGSSPVAGARNGGGAEVPAPDGWPGPSAERLRTLYTEFVEAKRQLGQPIDKVRLETIEAAVNQQVPGVVAKHGASRVEFRVAVKDGKVILQAIPRK